MLLQKQRKSTFTILVICILGIGTWSYQSDAYGMGYGERIDGLLVGVDEAPDGVIYGMGRSRCVLKGISLTGLGVEAISYGDLHRACELYRRVDDLIKVGAWCSQWVFPGSPGECYQTGGGGGGGGTVSWEPEPFTGWGWGPLCGGGPVTVEYEDFKTVYICGGSGGGSG